MYSRKETSKPLLPRAYGDSTNILPVGVNKRHDCQHWVQTRHVVKKCLRVFRVLHYVWRSRFCDRGNVLLSRQKFVVNFICKDGDHAELLLSDSFFNGFFIVIEVENATVQENNNKGRDYQREFGFNFITETCSLQYPVLPKENGSPIILTHLFLGYFHHAHFHFYSLLYTSLHRLLQSIETCEANNEWLLGILFDNYLRDSTILLRYQSDDHQ